MKKKVTKRRKRKVGLPPGSLVYYGEKSLTPISFGLFKYNQEAYHEIAEEENLDNIKDKPEPGYSYWLNINGVNNANLFSRLTRDFQMDNLLVEDIMNTSQRPKIDEFPPHLFLTLKMMTYDAENYELNSEQVSLVLGENYLLSFQEQKGDVFESVRNRIKTESSNIRQKKSDYIFYRLIDVIVDHYFIITDQIDEQIEKIENDLFLHFDENQLESIQGVKKAMLKLKRSIIPLKESVNTLQIMDSPLLDEGTKKFVKDVHDHLNQISDNIDTEKDLLGMLMDIYLNRQSNETNRVMKVLTIIATIFIPLTFLVGIYGMNFEYMPELSMKYAYPVLLGIMIALVVAMLAFFRKKKWI